MAKSNGGCRTCAPAYEDIALQGVPVTVRFVRDRNFTPPSHRQITVAYKAGMVLPIRQDWAADLINDGDAVAVDDPAISGVLGDDASLSS